MSFAIDNKNTAAKFSLFFKRGVWSELLKLPTPKERAFYDWPDEHGKNYDDFSPTIFEPLQYNIGCYLSSTSLARLQEQREVLLNILKKPEGFNLRVDALGRSFALRYITSPDLNIFNPRKTINIIYTDFTLVLENNFAPVGVDFYLADVNGLILSYPDKPIQFEQQKQLF
ncbi:MULTISPECIES: hypothetical protein [Sphingobacterium]|uniref:hypothetical protein n=1 Tax=Sphingobacterium TaxID=28453 RepID=UPI000E9D9B08|nr:MULTISPECIES: hypothetical protein [Sphingobacterium]HAF36725.1 hypothetical protein [Sphingobacterium sp.]HAL54510.1 hypothetical protein [Sphingobacterium sp.]HAT93925.1 hypothetical protein [Sphingobacterium sp.]